MEGSVRETHREHKQAKASAESLIRSATDAAKGSRKSEPLYRARTTSNQRIKRLGLHLGCLKTTPNCRPSPSRLEQQPYSYHWRHSHSQRIADEIAHPEPTVRRARSVRHASAHKNGTPPRRPRPSKPSPNARGCVQGAALCSHAATVGVPFAAVTDECSAVVVAVVVFDLVERGHHRDLLAGWAGGAADGSVSSPGRGVVQRPASGPRCAPVHASALPRRLNRQLRVLSHRSGGLRPA
jgi:hypothetical protein